MILPQSPTQSVAQTKEGSSTILGPPIQSAVPTDQPRVVTIKQPSTAPKQVVLPTVNGRVNVDKDSLLNGMGRANAFADAFSEIPEENRLWETPGVVQWF